LTFAASAPLVVSKTSLATLRPRWMQAADQRQQRHPPVEAVRERRDGDPEQDRDERRGQEGQPRRAQEEPAERELRTHLAALLGRDLLQVAVRLRDAALRVLEERHLLFVPVLHPVRRELEPSLRAAQRSPQGDVAALVVADPGLRADMAEDDVDPLVDRRLRLTRHRAEYDDLALRIDAELGSDGHRIPLSVDVGDHGMAEALRQSREQLLGRLHASARATSKTCGAWSVLPSSQR
jgi:hypothetical protein